MFHTHIGSVAVEITGNDTCYVADTHTHTHTHTHTTCDWTDGRSKGGGSEGGKAKWGGAEGGGHFLQVANMVPQRRFGVYFSNRSECLLLRVRATFLFSL